MASLSGTLPPLQNAFAQLAQFGAARGISIGVADYGGVRTQSDTARIVSYRQADFDAAVRAGQVRADTTLQQFRPIAPFGQSYHNYGAAFDVAILARPASITEAQAQAILGSYAPNVGLRWGGTFHGGNPDSGADFPHFELAIPLGQARALYEQSGGTASGAPGSLNLPSLSDLLPSLTPSDDVETYGAVDEAGFPIMSDYMIADDSGDDAAVLSMPPEGVDVTMLALGVVMVGVVLWAVKRQFS